MERKLIYGIYPRSFVSSDASMHGSAFRAIADASEKFLQLNPDYVWMNPIFYSGGCDGGYDIVSPYLIDVIFGSEADFDALVNGPLKGKVLLDIVFNHISIKSPLFLSDLIRTEGPTNCLWATTPNNWDSLFGGSAWAYRKECNKYYLHLFSKGQADLNLINPWVTQYFSDVVRYWLDRGVAGFRIDTCNILQKPARLVDSQDGTGMPKGFEFYHQSGSPEILRKIFESAPPCFTVGETVAASNQDMQELCGPLTCCFNAGVNDAADNMFLSPATCKDSPDYIAWFKALIDASKNENFCFQLESHDFPRSTNRFHTDPRTLAFLTFMLPFKYVCLYQGQEIGMHNRNDFKDATEICRADPHAKGIYEALLTQGMSEADAFHRLKFVSRLHARIPASQIYGERYDSQMNPEPTLPVLSVFHLYQKLIELWKTDPVLLHGDIVIHNMTQDGVFLFSRVYGDDYWDVHLDFSDSGRSYITNGKITIH